MTDVVGSSALPWATRRTPHAPWETLAIEGERLRVNLILSHSLSLIKPTVSLELRQLDLILEVTGPSPCTVKIVKEMGVMVLGLKFPWHLHDTNNATTSQRRGTRCCAAPSLCTRQRSSYALL
jgi:hypothetical protein